MFSQFFCLTQLPNLETNFEAFERFPPSIPIYNRFWYTLRLDSLGVFTQAVSVFDPCKKLVSNSVIIKLSYPVRNICHRESITHRQKTLQVEIKQRSLYSKPSS